LTPETGTEHSDFAWGFHWVERSKTIPDEGRSPRTI
jgi:hypothetical protein